MATKVLAPRLGEGVTELTIVKWLKHEGETINELESLLEVETDKVVTEIPSPVSGILLRLVVPENGVANVGSVIAWIGQPGENIFEANGSGSSEQVRAKANDSVPGKIDLENNASENGVERTKIGFISPVVAKIARERNVDLKQVGGSGLGGRITKKDILDYLETGKDIAAKPVPAENDPGDRMIPHNVIRKAIAERMVVSKQTSAHVLTAMEADMSRVMAHLSANKEAYARDGLNLTYTAYFIIVHCRRAESVPGG